mmetsp:Transcript_87349/g.174462  ORF Transcript_87349/g.174462 Transcript_87349/m.174462 type:complete len:198 (-) Transcript_87349:661-1254(-)
MKFQSNQFKFANWESGDKGSNKDSSGEDVDSESRNEARVSAAAIFAYTSRINHCCKPSAFVDMRRSAQTPGAIEEGDGLLRVRAIRALAAGERVTINYGPAELVNSWTLEQRREYLKQKCGFVCGCERCVKEETSRVPAIDADAAKAAKRKEIEARVAAARLQQDAKEKAVVAGKEDLSVHQSVHHPEEKLEGLIIT